MPGARPVTVTADSLSATIGANMGEIIRFVPKYERERARLIRRARATYDSIFPPADPVSEKHNKAPVNHTDSGADAHRKDGVLLS
jgi:hypothetical protein